MKTKKLSKFRVLVAAFAIVGGLWLSWRNVEDWQHTTNFIANDPWFAPYADVTATPKYDFEQNVDEHGNIVLAFIVSDKENVCDPSWGAAYTLDEAGEILDLDRRIARLRMQKGDVVVSFGGQLNSELSVKCTDTDSLLEAYKTVINRYGLEIIDLDIEGDGLNDNDALKRRAKVIAKLQSDKKNEGKNLAIWLTLPVAPFGMTEQGTNAVATMLEAGVDLAGVNAMTMDYGKSREELSMFGASKQALIETHRQLRILFERAGINLNDGSLWKKIGATPMIGQNDVAGEIFTQEDAKLFNEFAITKGINRMSMWSANRDIECGENYVNTQIVSDSCSGVSQKEFEFAKILSQGFDGDIKSNSKLTTTTDPKEDIAPDDPSTSPYQIWSEDGIYLKGTKVVWHHSVYEAKWWTQGDSPDNPVLQSWETPWQLIGPVLPGETPIPQPTLPDGTYPNWSGLEIYEAGQRVLYQGVAYSAKWWTQGDSPAAAGTDPNNSPWKPLTREQVEEILSRQTDPTI